MLGHTARALGVVVGIGYPVLVYLALRSAWSPRTIGLLALAVVVPWGIWRASRMPPAARTRLLQVPMVLGGLLGLSALLDDERFIFAMPVVISMALLGVFGASLRSAGPTMVESFARLVEPELDDAKVAHCRQATVAWCVFFVVNALVAGTLAALGAREAWAIYAGGVAYVLMGLMFAGEMVVRVRRFGWGAVRLRPSRSGGADAAVADPDRGGDGS